MTRRQGTSPWVYVGCGCLALCAVMVIVVAGGGYMGYTKIRGYVEDLEDPERRNARALELLGAEEMPDGYFTLFFIPVPWVFDFVMLTDSEDANQTLEAMDEDVDPSLLSGRFFFYVRSTLATDPGDDDHFGVVRREMGDGRIRIEVSDQRFISRQQLDQGQLTLGVQEITWTGHRGSFVDETGDAFDGLFSVMEVACPGDGALRSAVWFQRAAEGESVDTMNVVGSPADLPTLQGFMDHFNLCAK